MFSSRHERMTLTPEIKGKGRLSIGTWGVHLQELKGRENTCT